jgi:GT2 family glycosyltransferase
MNFNDITISLVLFRSEKVVFQCLKSINKVKKIIIFDNSNDTDLKKTINKKYPNIKYILSKKNIGYGHGIKHGLKSASGKILSWTHADLQIDIEDVVNFFKKNQLKLKEQKMIIKGRRTKRSTFNIFFTKGS